jgi:hypothetical protein
VRIIRSEIAEPAVRDQAVREAAEILQPAYREVAGSTRNLSQITCSTRGHLPPWKRSAKSP